MLKLKQVKKQYGDFCLDCSLEVPKGCISGLLGTNGAGKTSTFKVITGLIQADSGNVEIFGKDIKKLSIQDRERIGVVWPDSGFSGYLTITDLIKILRNMYDTFSPTQFSQQCKNIELPLNKKIKEFSSGMKAKLKLLVALSHEADLLILDEPTNGLDVLARDTILDMLREYMLSGERSILISSHISSDLENLCDDYYFIEQGKIKMHENADTLLEDYGILKVSEEQYRNLDKNYLLRKKKESYGYAVLTNQKQFYMENYTELIIEKSHIDQMLILMTQGEKI